MTCTRREAPSRTFAPSVFNNINTRPTLVAPEDPNRRSVLIVNTSTVTVYVLPINGVDPTQGWPLGPNEGITINTISPVYLITAAGTVGAVKVMTEVGAA